MGDTHNLRKSRGFHKTKSNSFFSDRHPTYRWTPLGSNRLFHLIGTGTSPTYNEEKLTTESLFILQMIAKYH